MYLMVSGEGGSWALKTLSLIVPSITHSCSGAACEAGAKPSCHWMKKISQFLKAQTFGKWKTGDTFNLIISREIKQAFKHLDLHEVLKDKTRITAPLFLPQTTTTTTTDPPLFINPGLKLLLDKVFCSSSCKYVYCLSFISHD